MPGNCGAEARCFRSSTDWLRKGSYFSIATASIERLVETRTERACVLVVTPLVSIMKDQVGELKRLGVRAFAVSLGDEKEEWVSLVGYPEPL